MDPITLLVLVSLALFLSVFANLRSWFGRGGGRIRIDDSWVDVSRRELDDILNKEMTNDEYQTMQAALSRSDTKEAQAMLATAALRYLRKTGRITR